MVGPTHPYTGGIAQHTTRLALELEKHGHRVRVESWSAQYPKALYPGPDRVPDGAPEVGLPSEVHEDLAWFNPVSWWVVGRRLRTQDVVALSIPTPFHAVPYLVLLAALGRSAQSVGIVHNVLPHEPGPLDHFLMGLLLRRLNRVIVHGTEAHHRASELGVPPCALTQCSLPSPWPHTPPPTLGNAPRSTTPEGEDQSTALRVLFFGTVRHYKGLDVLLESLAMTPGVELIVAGEFWDDDKPYRDQINRLGLESRVTIKPGYVAEAEFAELFADADLLVLPYRSGTGSIVRELGFRFGLPVIATDAGAIADGIDHDANGMVVTAGDPQALAEALTHASRPEVLTQWREGVATRRDTQGSLWDTYCTAVLYGKKSPTTTPGGEK